MTGEYPFTGGGFALSFAIPNFFIHLTMAYALLRHRGVPLGKLDYLGGLWVSREDATDRDPPGGRYRA